MCKLGLCSVCEPVIRRSLHIDKIHKNYNPFLIIPTLSSKSNFCRQYCIFQEPAEEKIDPRFLLIEFIEV